MRKTAKKIKISPRGGSHRPGRNEPCWCGSGRKYKDCHLKEDDTRRARQRDLTAAQDTLTVKIIDAAREDVATIPAAMERFWDGKYTADQLAELEDREERGPERFLTWLAFDFQPEGGHTLVQRLQAAADAGTFELDDDECTLLATWGSVRLRPYVVQEVLKGTGIRMRDLLTNEERMVTERSASRRLLADEVVVAHLVPVVSPTLELVPATPPDGDDGNGDDGDDGDGSNGDDGNGDSSDVPLRYGDDETAWFLTGAGAQLTPDTHDRLIEVATLHLTDVQRTLPAATLDDVALQRSEVFNHFVMSLPEEVTPGVLDAYVQRTRVALQLAGVLPVPDDDTPDDDTPDDDTPGDDTPDDDGAGTAPTAPSVRRTDG